jgi:hypothetical protein
MRLCMLLVYADMRLYYAVITTLLSAFICCLYMQMLQHYYAPLYADMFNVPKPIFLLGTLTAHYLFVFAYVLTGLLMELRIRVYMMMIKQ